MELFPASTETQWNVIKKVIDDCDYYIVIIGGRYGSVGDKGLSYTEMEYRYAEKKGIPIIAFPHYDVGKLPKERTESDPEMTKKLEDFIDHVSDRLYKPWESPTDLGGKVSRALVQLIKTYPRVGWVRANNIPDKDVLTENINLRKRIEDLESKLSSIDDAIPSGTEDYAQGEDMVDLSYLFYEHANNISTTLTITMSWNEIMQVVLPVLDTSESESQIKNALVNYIQKQSTKPGKVDIPSTTLTLVITQLRALKIIRPAANIGYERYYRLTPYGESLFLKSSSIRKSR